MIAKYKGKYYRYVKNKRESIILTSQSEKTEDNFVFNNGVFYKEVKLEDLEEVFDVKYVASYNTGLEGVSTDWDISEVDKEKQCVLLRFACGILPGWEIEEKNVCTKWVDVKNLYNVKEIRNYKRKNNQDFSEIIEKEIDVQQVNFISF